MLSIDLFSAYMDLIYYYEELHLCFAMDAFLIRWIRFMLICYELKYEVLDSEDQDLSGYENTSKGCIEDEAIVKIWRVKL